MPASRSPIAPLLNFELQPPKPTLSPDDSSSIWAENDVPTGKKRKTWLTYIPTFGASNGSCSGQSTDSCPQQPSP